MTRRALKPQPDYRGPAGCETDPDEWGWEDDMGDHIPVSNARLRWAVGDRLWVREDGEVLTHPYASDPTAGEDRWEIVGWRHAADGTIVGYNGHNPTDYVGDCAAHRHPSIHMPRWASRITLDVTAVRVERLQDISEDDAVAEGAFKGKATGRVFNNVTAMRLGGPQWKNARDWFADLWESINGSGSWSANPWVSVTTFRREALDGK